MVGGDIIFTLRFFSNFSSIFSSDRFPVREAIRYLNFTSNTALECLLTNFSPPSFPGTIRVVDGGGGAVGGGGGVGGDGGGPVGGGGGPQQAQV